MIDFGTNNLYHLEQFWHIVLFATPFSIKYFIIKSTGSLVKEKKISLSSLVSKVREHYIINKLELHLKC